MIPQAGDKQPVLDDSSKIDCQGLGLIPVEKNVFTNTRAYMVEFAGSKLPTGYEKATAEATGVYSVDGEGYRRIFVATSNWVRLQSAAKIGRQCLLKALYSNALKKKEVTLKKESLHLENDGTVLVLPHNIDSYADWNIHRLTFIADKLNIKIKFAEADRKEIGTANQAWQNAVHFLSDCIEAVLRAIESAEQRNVQMVPYKTKKDRAIVRKWLNCLVYKWASQQKVAGYLQKSVRTEGNLSMDKFAESCTECGLSRGCFATEMLQVFYGFIDRILFLDKANDALRKVMNTSYFVSAFTLRSSHLPKKSVWQRSSKESKLVEINVFKYSDIRFLFKNERALASQKDKAKLVTDKIQKFEESGFSTRDYAAMDKYLIDLTQECSKGYYALRAACNKRLNIVKKARQAIGLDNRVQDAFYNSEDNWFTFVNQVKTHQAILAGQLEQAHQGVADSLAALRD